MLVYQAWHIGEKNHASLRRPLAVAETHYFFRELINIIFSCYFFLIYFSKVKTALFFKLVVEEYIYL